MGCPFYDLEWSDYIQCHADNGTIQCPIVKLCDSDSDIVLKIMESINLSVNAAEEARLLYEGEKEQ